MRLARTELARQIRAEFQCNPFEHAFYVLNVLTRQERRELALKLTEFWADTSCPDTLTYTIAGEE